jgi:hypothetical protein
MPGLRMKYAGSISIGFVSLLEAIAYGLCYSEVVSYNLDRLKAKPTIAATSSRILMKSYPRR